MLRLLFTTFFVVHTVYSDVIFQPISNTPIFAENLGKTSLYHRTWKLVIGVDTSNINPRLESIRKTYSEVYHLCHHCAEEFQINVLHNRINRVADLQLTLHQILGAAREKRGILNIIGTISKTLFGTLDDNDMEIINQEFDKLYADQKIITGSINNQTRIMKTLLNSASHDLQILNNESGKLINQLNKMINSTNINAQNILMVNMITLCSIAIEEISEDINLIINAVNDGKHGILHPQILTPNILIKELQKIEEENNVKYPIRLIPQNYQHIVDISEITVSITNKNLIYILKVPEIEQPNLQTLHLIPIPIRHGRSFIAPIPSHEVILINPEKSFYVPTDFITLQNCKKLENTFICKRVQPSFLVSEIQNCETNIIKSQAKIISDKICEFSVFKISELAFIPLHDSNQYLIIPEKEIEINTICNEKNKIITLKEPSLVYSNSDCIIETPKSILKLRTSLEHNFDIKFKKNISFTINKSDLDLLDSQLPLIQETLHRDNLNSLKRSIDTMEESIKGIKNNRRTKTWVETGSDILTYLGYSSLTLVTIYVLYKIGIFKLCTLCIPKQLCIDIFCVKTNVNTTPIVRYATAPSESVHQDENIRILPQIIKLKP